ncbi:MAG: deoxyribodipyrimidine photo-lyase, partial [Alphaproteobacteria bacterium]|nr:deoxyribodipyrimidine photo-lyase [Alphaproteobacteria bacterium]
AKPVPAPEKLEQPASWPASYELEDLALLPSGFDWAGGLKDAWQPGEDGAQARLDEFVEEGLSTYKVQRDRPDKSGTSRLSPHLRFGEISARQIWAQVHAAGKHDTKGGSAFLREVVWREFCHHLLYFFPELPDAPLKSDYESFPWRQSEKDLKAWQRGETGYPIVDAGMRELWQTGWMHNRVRMITGSFLVKDLRLDWRHGEAWFWDTLVDADPANNVAGWQWVAGCGTDAAPYFRIFNPVTQAEKFDPDGAYIRRWVPELKNVPDEYLAKPWDMPPLEAEEAGFRLGETYPHPLVDHQQARKEALAALDEMKEHASA